MPNSPCDHFCAYPVLLWLRVRRPQKGERSGKTSIRCRARQFLQVSTRRSRTLQAGSESYAAGCWVAHHVTNQLSLVELDDVPVKQVLHTEEKRKTYHFVARDTHVDDVRGLFASHEILEAVFITASGKESEGLLPATDAQNGQIPEPARDSAGVPRSFGPTPAL